MKNHKFGYAFFAHPAILSDNGSSHIEGNQSPYAVNGKHYFVVLVGNDNALVVVPCFSGPGFRRIEVPATARHGHPAWTNKPCYIAFHQFCLTTLQALEKAAYAANNKSSTTEPNFIDEKWLLSAWKNNFIPKKEAIYDLC